MRVFLINALLLTLIFPALSQDIQWESVVLAEDEWTYVLPTEQPDITWKDVVFDDSQWLAGPAGIGYADGDDATIVGATHSVYMRREFEITSLDSLAAVVFNMDYDDGFVAYLNGVEIARENIGVPGDIPAWNQELDTEHEAVMYQGGYPSQYLFENVSDLLSTGPNVLAVEIHNRNLGSSDLSSIPFLHVASTASIPAYIPTPEWFVPPVICNENTGTEYNVVLTTGAWGGEVSWQILSFEGVVFAEGSGYWDNAVFQHTICLPDGCYDFYMLDSWGDGWNGGSFEMFNQNDELVLNGELSSGVQEVISFSSYGSCELLGCTDPEALNYDIWANTDDGSCVVLGASNLPLVVIDTDGQGIPDDPRVVAHMGIVDNESGENSITDPFNGYDGQIAIEIRGSSSQMFPKKSYALETQDSLGMNNNVSLLGMPVENDWILHGPYSDKTLMRNAITFELGRRVGRYTTRTKYCEVFIDGDYRGVYMLMENIKIDENRVDIATLLPTDTAGNELTGGYLLKIDKFTGDFEGGWTSPYTTLGGGELVIQHHKPEADELNEPQMDYIMEHVTAFEDALAGPDFQDSLLGFRPFVEVESFVDLYLINELSRNIDGYRLSTYFHKQKDSDGGKIVMGPWWDYNLSFANADYCSCWDYEGWEVDGGTCGESNPFWFERMMEDTAYQDLVRCTWEDYRSGPWSNDSIHGLIDSLSTYLADAVERNYVRWPTLGTYVWPNYFIGQTYEEELQIMRDWTDGRLDWIDANLPGTCISGCMDPVACNYDPEAFYESGDCEYAEDMYDCDGNCIFDYDGDLICDQIDNCPDVYNPDQLDSDQDGEGDECETVSIDEYEARGSLQIVRVTDVLGRTVSRHATGVVIIEYEDGSKEKTVRFALPTE